MVPPALTPSSNTLLVKSRRDPFEVAAIVNSESVETASAAGVSWILCKRFNGRKLPKFSKEEK